jgi:tetratricopeptide (TPR) repeat protein
MRWCVLSQEYLKKGKIGPALRALDRAIRRHPDPGYLYVRALLILLDGRPAEALQLLGSLRRRQTFPPVAQDALLLWMGRCLDLLGRRGEAREQYRLLLGQAGLAPQLAAAARRGLRRPFRKLPGVFEYTQLGPLEF